MAQQVSITAFLRALSSADGRPKDAPRENATYSITGGHPLDIGLIIKSGMSIKEVWTNYATSVDVNQVCKLFTKNIHGEWRHLARCLRALLSKHCSLITPLPVTMSLCCYFIIIVRHSTAEKPFHLHLKAHKRGTEVKRARRTYVAIGMHRANFSLWPAYVTPLWEILRAPL